MTYIHGLGIDRGNYLSWFLNYLIELPLLIGLTYLIAYYIIPRFLRRKKPVLSLILIICSFIVFSFINLCLDEWIINPYLGTGSSAFSFYDLRLILRNAFGLVFPVVIFLVVSFARFSHFRKYNQKLGERKILESELAMIRNRLHPVFLRDALDDMYVMSRNPDHELPDMILKISDILNYFLFDCTLEKLPIRKEEQVIRKYLSFEKLRYGEFFNFDIFIDGNMENSLISPYILFPLVRASCSYTDIQYEIREKLFLEFRIVDNTLDFTISRNINVSAQPREINFDWKEEIAMARKRLDLVYPWNYDLELVETKKRFQIILKLLLEN